MNKATLTSVTIAPGAPVDVNGRHIDYIALREAEASSIPSRITILNAGAKETWFRRVHCEASWIDEIGLFVIEDATLSGHGYVFLDRDFLLDGSEPSRLDFNLLLPRILMCTRFFVAGRLL